MKVWKEFISKRRIFNCVTLSKTKCKGGYVMTVKKLYFIPAGRCMLDHSSVNSALTPGKLLNLPVWCYLLETEEDPILVDTGMPESAVNNEGLLTVHLQKDRFYRK